MKNKSLLIKKSVRCDQFVVRSFWDVNADDHYRNYWPKDKPLPYVDGATAIVYSQSGRGQINLKDGRVLHPRGNNILFLDPENIESYWCVGGYWKLYWIEVVGLDMARFPIEQQINLDNPIHFETQFIDFKNALLKGEWLDLTYAASLLNKMIYEWLIVATQKQSAKNEQLLQSLIDEMHNRVNENWQVKSMAEYMGFSEQYLRKLFREYTKLSPKHYFNELKLEIIHGRLRKEHYNISQLAELYGFTDAFHLSKAFKRKYGYAPSTVKPQEQPLIQTLLFDAEVE